MRPLNRADLAELISNGENSLVEFKRDGITADNLAKVLVGLLNHEGGRIVLGVEDDGAVSGLKRDPKEVEEWIMDVGRDRVQPAIIPSWQPMRWDDATVLGVVSVPSDAPDKPYKVKRGASWVTRIRVGTTTRDASREEEERLYQRSGTLRYGLKPVPGADLDELDLRRLSGYFERVLGVSAPGMEETDAWRSLLRNVEFFTEASGKPTATVDGMLLFGRNPKRYLPQSGIRALCFAGTEMEYATRADEDLVGPLSPLRGGDGSLLEPGLIDLAMEFIRRNITPSAKLEGARRIDMWEYPLEVIREVIVNALVHRDYSIFGTEVDLMVFSDRVEVRSPGRLPNTVTTEGMRQGLRYARNQALVNVMRDYGYVEGRGMGVSAKVIPGMRKHNGTEPDLIEDEYRFTVRLWKDGPGA